MDEVRRPADGELCGHVVRRGDAWEALTVFGSTIGRHRARNLAVEQVMNHGLAILAERWTLRHGRTDDSQVVCIIEANPSEVTVALDYDALPGVPTLTITAGQLADGEWVLVHGCPTSIDIGDHTSAIRSR
jgi:hypothetical protein